MVSKNVASRKEVASGIRNKKKEVDGKKKELEQLEKEKQAKLEKLEDARAGKFAKEKAGKSRPKRRKNIYEKQSCLFTIINIAENRDETVKRM